ncbi:hypothetical protein KR032_008062 [Drosophila birchii]|nr:hypothetical protein KR032_008062 [Drosophila birchii]
MSNSNNNDCKKSIWLETTDSKILHTGFVDFVKNYQQSCTDEDCVEPKLETEGPKSSGMSFSVKVSKSNLSLKSIAPSAISGTKCGVDDLGFDRFLDEWTANAADEAREHWFRMSKRDRAMYATVS